MTWISVGSLKKSVQPSSPLQESSPPWRQDPTPEALCRRMAAELLGQVGEIRVKQLGTKVGLKWF